MQKPRLSEFPGALAVVVLAWVAVACSNEDGGDCAHGTVACGEVCAALDTDADHCGSCDTHCDGDQACESGECVAAVLPPVVTASCADQFTEEETCSDAPSGTTYYVSTSGDDANDGLSQDSPIRTLSRAGELKLAPGDRVLFRCGDLWRNERLTITQSGAECQHIVYGSYPALCSDQPRFSGSYPITGWVQDTDGIWVADLSAGDNAGHFPNGVNQLFRGDQRLPIGRWPNLGDPDFPGGYSRIVTHDGGTRVGDPRLPGGNWSGAAMHHFVIRWVMLNSEVQSSEDGTLNLSAPISCDYDQCGDPNPDDPADFGWGYFLNDHRLTLDERDEWYYDRSTQELFLVSDREPTAMEGSVIPDGVVDPKSPTNDEGFHGLVDLGPNASAPIHHVVVENLRLENGWRDGIGTPINTTQGEPTDLVIRCNTIRNPDSKGINLAIWAFPEDDWRGGERIYVLNNVIDGPNHFGVKSLARDSVFQGNLVTQVGLLPNLGTSGLGCEFGNGNCHENGTGIFLPAFDSQKLGSRNVIARRNRVQGSGSVGIGTPGQGGLFEENVIIDSCATKGDCGAIGCGTAQDLVVRRNIVQNVISPNEAFSSTYIDRYGFGIYVDVDASVECAENTFVGTQQHGILFTERSTGKVLDNTVYDVRGRQTNDAMGGSLVYSASGAQIEEMTGNVLVAVRPMLMVFTESGGRILSSDQNHYIQPYSQRYLFREEAEWVVMSLPEWQEFSGEDAESEDAWFNSSEGAEAETELFVNDTAQEQSISLEGVYLDLDQQSTVGSIQLAPFSSRVLVRD